MPSQPEGIIAGADGVRRCWWSAEPAIYQEYHDNEWGMPVSDDFRLYEKICLEGFQSGLSWLIILRKRGRFREVFAGFDFHEVARFGPQRIDKLVADAGIIRHRGKIESTVNNARQAIALQAEFGSLDAYFRQYEPPASNRPRKVTKATLTSLTTCPESVALSKDLRKRGWSFVGPTTCYAFMQAVGLVNDHLDGCPARARVERARAERPAAR